MVDRNQEIYTIYHYLANFYSLFQIHYLEKKILFFLHEILDDRKTTECRISDTNTVFSVDFHPRH